jgi:hypothetical protein
LLAIIAGDAVTELDPTQFPVAVVVVVVAVVFALPGFVVVGPLVVALC